MNVLEKRLIARSIFKSASHQSPSTEKGWLQSFLDQMGNCCGITRKMQGNREVRDNSEGSSNSRFDNFGGGFGFVNGMFPSIFGGKDPFDDPFFTRPISSSFDSSTSYRSNSASYVPHTKNSKGPVIKELDGDNEEISDVDEDYDAIGGASWANRNPHVVLPEEQASEHEKDGGDTSKEIYYMNDHSKAEGNKSNARNISFQRVTYGGVDGPYYTATTNRRTGNDGATVEEHRQADSVTGQASHRISRGINNKGHSVVRKLGSDGKVDTTQTLHNIHEDELPGFEQSWRHSSGGHFRGWNDTYFKTDLGSSVTNTGHGPISAWGSFLDPFSRQRSSDHNQAQSSTRAPKKVVRINIE